MRGNRLVTACVVMLLLAAAVVSPSYAQEQELRLHITQVDTSAFPTVTVYVSVTDAFGEPVGIDPAQLQLYENGVAVENSQIEGAGTVGRLSTLLIMDVSGSMNMAGKLAAAQAAAQAYIELMRPGDEVGLLTFNTQTDYVQPLTQDADVLAATIAALTAQEDTAMYDALLEGVALLEETTGRKAILVLTDGLDNRSSVEDVDVLSAIGPEGLSISTIGLGDPSHGDATNAGLDVPGLMSLASGAGGEFSYANDEESLTALYASLARTLQSEYILSYTSPSELRDGFQRELTVALLDQPASSQAAGYNPGGLIPEVGDTLPGGFFIGLLTGLILLLFLPLGLETLRNSQGQAESKPPKSKIRFLD